MTHSSEEHTQAQREYLMRFIDGPMTGRGNIRNLAGTTDVTVPKELFGWPLPDRLLVLCHEGVARAAMWDPQNIPDGLPKEITESPNRVTYRKVGENELPDDVDDSPLIMRGATYQLEGSQN